MKFFVRFRAAQPMAAFSVAGLTQSARFDAAGFESNYASQWSTAASTHLSLMFVLPI